MAAHRIHQSRAHDHVGGRRQLLEAEPSDGDVFLGSDVHWRSLPVTHKPSAEERRLVCGSSSHATQMGRRVRRYLHAEFFVQLSPERTQL